MARPTESRPNDTAGFAPETRQAPGLGVFAPLNVQAAPSRAQALADALGVATRIAQPQLVKAVEKNAFDRTTAGMADAANNSIDAKRQAEDQLYDKGAKQVVAEKRTIDALQEYTQRYETEFDKNLGEHMLAEDIDSFAKERLGDLINDPEMARVVAKRFMPFVQKMTGQHRANLSKEFKQEAIDTTVSGISADVDLGIETDFEGNVQRLTSLLGDRTLANQTVISAIVNRAAVLGAPEIIDKFIPNAAPGGVNVRATYADMIEKGRATAIAERDKRDAANKALSKGDLEIGYVDRLNSKQWLTDRELRKQQQLGMLTEGERVSWYSRSENARLQDLSISEATTMADSGLPLWSLKPIMKEKDFEALLFNRVDREAQRNGGSQIAAAIKIANDDGYADPRVSEMLNRIAPDFQTEGGPEAFKKAAEVYNSIPPHLRTRFVTNETRRAEYEQFNALVGAGTPAKAAAREVAEFNSEVAAQNRARYNTELKTERTNIGALQVSDGGWFSSSIAVDGLANAPQVRMQIDRKLNLYTSRGMAPEEALKVAHQEVMASNAFVDVGDGKHLLMPTTARAPKELGEALSYAYTKLPDYLKQAGVTLADTKGVRFSYSPTGDNTRLILIDERGIPLSSKSFAINTITDNYLAGVKADKHARRQKGHERLLEYQRATRAIESMRNPETMIE